MRRWRPGTERDASCLASRRKRAAKGSGRGGGVEGGAAAPWADAAAIAARPRRHRCCVRFAAPPGPCRQACTHGSRPRPLQAWPHMVPTTLHPSIRVEDPSSPFGRYSGEVCRDAFSGRCLQGSRYWPAGGGPARPGDHRRGGASAGAHRGGRRLPVPAYGRLPMAPPVQRTAAARYGRRSSVRPPAR